ncbi:hypothetical protein GCM10023353_32930 [Tomitella cavernea]|uniref:Uncharacterized protein n=1 Tax=Tomitella cavernea TaxID=1387982 RepID=A0ABP9CYR3_9ACTN
MRVCNAARPVTDTQVGRVIPSTPTDGLTRPTRASGPHLLVILGGSAADIEARPGAPIVTGSARGAG